MSKRITMKSEANVTVLLILAINISKECADVMHVMVEGTRAMQVSKLLRERDIPYQVIGNEKGMVNPPWPASRSISNPVTLQPYKRLSMLDWKEYYPLAVIYDWLSELEKIFPSTCTVSAIGKTAEGRDIKMLKISNSDASNTGVWLDGCTHAREWITVSVVTYIADYLARNFKWLPSALTNKDWYIVPVVNPDGYSFSHTTDRMWRKNRARIGSNIVGVDLNRNFGYNWGQSGVDAFTSNDPANINYRGQSSFSEPETSAIKDIILYSGTPFKIFLTFHSFSEVISFPWCCRADPCADYVSLLEGGTVMAKAMFECTGRMYKVGDFKDVMYFASGTSIDWSYGVARVPFSYLVELRSKEHRFLLPKTEILDCCRETLSGVMALAEFVDTKRCLNCVVLESN